MHYTVCIKRVQPFFYNYGTNRLNGKINYNPVKQNKNKYSSFFADLIDLIFSILHLSQKQLKQVTPWGKPLGAPDSLN